MNKKYEYKDRNKKLSLVAKRDQLNRIVKQYPYSENSYAITLNNIDLDRKELIDFSNYLNRHYKSFIFVQEMPQGIIKQNRFLNDYQYYKSKPNLNQWMQDEFSYHYHMVINSEKEPTKKLKKIFPGSDINCKEVYSNNGGGYLLKQLDNIVKTNKNIEGIFYYDFKIPSIN